MEVKEYMVKSCLNKSGFNIFELCLLIFHRHLKEIQDLQSRQKHEIESLYTKLGKVPPAVIIPPAAPLSGRRRRPTKSKGSKSSRISSLGSKSPQLSGKKPWTRSAMAVLSFISVFNSVYNLLNICCFC